MSGLRGASNVRAVVFDTDGVLLDSASLHAAAWKAAFDGCLEVLASGASGRERQPSFDADGEYRRLVDGKARFDGARAFLEARGLALPAGHADDPPGCASVWAVAARKEQEFTQMLRTRAVPSFPDVVPALDALRESGTGCAAVSASRHARELLEAAGIHRRFEAVIDGGEATRLGLSGKPDPALFLEAASRLRVHPRNTAVVEDALAGVEAGRRGDFCLVIGVDRAADPRRAAALADRGADLVVRELTELIGDLPGAPP
ncbi:HAD family hydrolase [Streptomyces sp. NBC_01013]|uniref:HAD family hydrolase n=1 Tax=Streptomyces sp. NBC_01013 TaxID=2903718 RepID=UPI00386349AF|nr:HAD-IA family hydrolase [Streptomyces sp. NBC_01013]